MGTRFLLTRDSPVADDVKQVYLSKTLTDTVVTTRVDGVPHRVLRTPLIDGLERSGQLSGLARAAANAGRFRKLSGLSWPALVRQGLAMRHDTDLSWSQVLMAANTPMLLKAAMVESPAGPGRDGGGPGRRAHRGPALMRRAHRPDHG